MATATKRRSNSRCEWCDRRGTEDNEVVDGICQECEDEHVYCALCEEWQSEDGHCRHVFWGDGLGWCGSGATEFGPDACEDGFYALLDYQGREKALELQRALRRHHYYFQWHGSMLGPSDLLADFGRGRWYYRWLCERDCEVLPAGVIDRMGLGLGWLVSLWSGGPYDRDKPDDFPRTPDLDRLTARWVGDWLRRREVVDSRWQGEFELFAGPDGGCRWARHLMPGAVPADRRVVTVRPAPPSALWAGDVALCAHGGEEFLALVSRRSTTADRICVRHRATVRRGRDWPEVELPDAALIGKVEKVEG